MYKFSVEQDSFIVFNTLTVSAYISGTWSFHSVVDDVAELFFWVDVILVVILPVAEVQSTKGVGLDIHIKPCPILQTFHSHLVH